MRYRICRILVIAITTYVVVVLIIAALQTRLIYFPEREYVGTPKRVGLAFEDLTLTTDDGVDIAVWYVARDAANGTILFCHGNAGNMGDRLFTLDTLHRLGFNVVMFDYRGYGRSAGAPSERGTYADAEAVWQYLTEERGESPGRIILMGRSLGGAVAIELATRHKPGALVVESTFTSIADLARVHYPLIPPFLVRHRYESIDKVGAIDCPKLFLHGQEDELIPLALAQQLFAAAAEPKQMIITPGGHNEAGFTYAPNFTRELAQFLQTALEPDP